jgi:hypothetical protein
MVPQTREVTVNVTTLQPQLRTGTRTVTEMVPQTREVTVNVTTLQPQQRTGTRTVTEMVSQTREVTVNVTTLQPQQRTGTRTRLVPETVQETVNVTQAYCEMVPYTYTVRVPVGGAWGGGAAGCGGH